MNTATAGKLLAVDSVVRDNGLFKELKISRKMRSILKKIFLTTGVFFLINILLLFSLRGFHSSTDHNELVCGLNYFEMILIEEFSSRDHSMLNGLIQDLDL